VENAITTASTAVQTINEETFSQVIQKAPEALNLNQTSIFKAKQAGQVLLDTIEGSDMSDLLDDKCNSYQLALKKTLEVMQERRKPVTQIINEIAKLFTSLEAEIDPKRPESIFSKIQLHRNKYAQQKLEILKQKEREAQRKLQSDKEKIEITSRITISLHQYFNNHLGQAVVHLNRLFDSIALSNFVLVKQEIESYVEVYSYTHYKAFAPSMSDKYAVYNTPEQVSTIITNVVDVNSLYSQFADKFKQTISEQKMSILDRFQSKLELLNEIAINEKNNKEEADRLKAIKEQERIDNERIAREEAEKRQTTAVSQAESTKQAEQMQTLFDVAADMQGPATSAKEAYVIDILNTAGWLLIAQFYFEKEGMKETPEKLEKKTLGQMKSFCEKYALKNEELIKSPYLVYREVAKATVKR